MWWLSIQNHIKVSITRNDKIRLRTWHKISIRFKFIENFTVPVESFGYVKCYSLSSSRPNKSPSNSIRDKYQKICGWTIYTGNWKKTFYFLKWSKFLYIDDKFSKDFINHKMNTNRAVMPYGQLWVIIEGTTSLTCLLITVL